MGMVRYVLIACSMEPTIRVGSDEALMTYSHGLHWRQISIVIHMTGSMEFTDFR